MATIDRFNLGLNNNMTPRCPCIPAKALCADASPPSRSHDRLHTDPVRSYILCQAMVKHLLTVSCDWISTATAAITPGRILSNMLTYCNRENNKIKKSTTSGAGADEVYTSHWEYFAVMDGLLRDCVKPRASISNKW